MIALGTGCMEIKKKGKSDSGASGNASDSSPKNTIPPGKTSSGGALPASLPLFQGIFALVLLLSLLLGYGLPYQPPKLEKHDYPEFPKDVRRYLFGAAVGAPGINSCRNWQDITDDIFGREPV